jgi:hypothetical protein
MLMGMQKGAAQGTEEGMREILGELMKDTLEPAKLAELMKGVGIDPSQLSGMIGQVPGLDPYRILGLERSASDDEVKKRYRELLHVLHPDKSGTPGTGHFFQLVMAAYEAIRKARGWQ